MKSRLTSLGAHAAWAVGGSSAAAVWWGVFGLCLWIYLPTAHWFGVGNIDGMAAAWPGWELVHHGTLRLDHARLPPVPSFEFLHVGGHIVSNRMAGVVLVDVPAQLLLLPLNAPPAVGGVLTAGLVTSVAMANLCQVLRRALPDVRLALAITGAVALGTGYWVNASAELWAHGPLALWLTLAMLALQRGRQWLAGAALAPAVWTRPHVALTALAIGVVLAASERRIRPLARIGLPAAAGMLGLVVWNGWMFGERSIGGGYDGAVRTATGLSASAVRQFTVTAMGSLVSPLRGLVVFSPFVLVGAVAICYGWRLTPPWARGCAIGGAAYQVAQWKLNSFTGGTGFFSYRLTLELVLLCTPAAAIGYDAWRARHSSVAILARLTTGVSVGVHFLGAFWFVIDISTTQFADPWTTSGVLRAATARGQFGIALAVLMFAIICAGCLWVRMPVRQCRAAGARELVAAISGEAPSARLARPTPDPPAA